MTTRKKRPARSVWCVVNANGVAVGVYPTKKAALVGAVVAISALEVVGPYLLAERVAHR